MDDPTIMTPDEGDRFKANQSISLIAICDDPDIKHGQVLNYSWVSNLTGQLGYGSSLSVRILEVGTHVITLTVNDGEFQKMATVTIVVEPREDITPPPTNGHSGSEDPLNFGLIAVLIAVLVIVGVVIFVARTKRRSEELEAQDEEEYKREHMERAHEAVKEAADRLETSKEWTEMKEDTEPATTQVVENGIEIQTTAVPGAALSMEVKKTEAAPKEIMGLFDEPTSRTPTMSDEERAQLQLDSKKRKYQNAIGRLPYGIPSDELKEWDWVDLATALASGEKRMTPDGRELTKVDGTWYFSDPKDTGSFLKEHAPKAAPEATKATKSMDKAEKLEKLEERLLNGDISEETYNKLYEKISRE
jgi:uncharacterized membrane protein